MATATFDDILAAQRETNALLSKQRSPLDGRTGAGKALLDAQRETTSVLGGELQDLKGKQPSPSQIKETNKDTKNEQDARFGALGKIFKNQIGKLTTAFQNLNKVAKGGLFAALTALGLFALADFLESPTFEKIREIVVEKLPPLLDRIYTNILKPVLDFFVPKFQKFFGDLLGFLEDPSFGGFVDLISQNKIAVASLVALLAPKLVLGALVKSFTMLTKTLNLLGTGRTMKFLRVNAKLMKRGLKRISNQLLLAAKPLLAGGLILAGIVTAFFALKDSIDFFNSEALEGKSVVEKLLLTAGHFFKRLFQIPMEFIASFIPEDLKEKFSVKTKDIIDGTIGFVRKFGEFFDEKIVQPVSTSFNNIKTKIGKKIDDIFEAVKGFFDKIVAPFQRAIRAFQEYDGIVPGGGVVEAGKAFFDPNYFGESPPLTTGVSAQDIVNRTGVPLDVAQQRAREMMESGMDKDMRGEKGAIQLIQNVNNVDQSQGKGATSNSFPGSRIVDPQDPNRNV